MEEKKNEQTEVSTSPVEEKTEDGLSVEQVSLGKFKDVGALFKAYNSLQSEFTKRCQRLKELEQKAESENNPEPAPESKQGITEEDKEEILKGYLKSVLGAKSKAIVLDGVGASIKTPSDRPRTLADAGEFAKNYFNKSKRRKHGKQTI